MNSEKQQYIDTDDIKALVLTEKNKYHYIQLANRDSYSV